jgi:site-specific recombinase XerC
MRRFCRWLVAEEELDQDLMAGMEQPKPPEHPVPVITRDELTRLLKEASGADFTGRRDEAIVRVLLDTGARISELAGMRLEDVDWDHEVIHVIGKGRPPRAVPLAAKTVRVVDRASTNMRTSTRCGSPAGRAHRGWDLDCVGGARRAGRDRGSSCAPFPPHVRASVAR